MYVIDIYKLVVKIMSKYFLTKYETWSQLTLNSNPPCSKCIVIREHESLYIGFVLAFKCYYIRLRALKMLKFSSTEMNCSV